MSSLTLGGGGGITARSILHPLLLVQRKASLHGYQRCGTGLETRSDTAERLALTALLLVLPRAEERLPPGSMCGEHCAAVRFEGEDVRLEGERVDELEMVCVRWTGIDDAVKGMEDLRMGSRFREAGGCREGALPDGRAREEEEELCEKHGWLIWSRAREWHRERWVHVRVSGRADWEIGLMERETPRHIEI